MKLVQLAWIKVLLLVQFWCSLKIAENDAKGFESDFTVLFVRVGHFGFLRSCLARSKNDLAPPLTSLGGGGAIGSIVDVRPPPLLQNVTR